MEFDENTGSKIGELQTLEQNLQSMIMQKQTVQIELNESLNALSELKKADDEVYKIVGGIMVRSSKDILSKELSEKQKVLEIRISTIEKQEKLLEEKADKLKEELSELIGKNKN